MSPQQVSDLVRRVLFLTGMGLIAGFQTATIAELSVDVPLPWPVRAGIMTGVFPALFVCFGLRVFPPRPGTLLMRVWLANAVVMLCLWGGGYFLTGSLAYEGPFETLATPLDRVAEFVPEWVFVYLTVYVVFLVPCFYIDDPKRLFTLDVAQLLALAVSYTTFLVFPVAIDRPALEVTDFSTWTLSIVHGQDPAWNCFPSTHCTACTVASLAMLREHKALGLWTLLSTLAICVSTVLTRQHFVLDVMTGVMLGTGFYLLAWAAMASPLYVEKLTPIFLMAQRRGKENEQRQQAQSGTHS